MTALAANSLLPKIVHWTEPEGIKIDYPMKAAAVIYKGSFVGALASGFYGSALTAGINFIGLAMESKTGGTNDGDRTIKLLVGGVFQATITATIAITDLGKALFAIDDNPLAMTLTSGSNSSIGRIINVPGVGGNPGGVPANTVIVKMKWPGESQGFSNAATLQYGGVIL